MAKRLTRYSILLVRIKVQVKAIKYYSGKNSEINNFTVINGVEEWILSFTADENEHW